MPTHQYSDAGFSAVPVIAVHASVLSFSVFVSFIVNALISL